MHAAPVCTFFKKQACERKFCKFSHPKPEPKSAPKHEQKADLKKVKNPENADQNGNNRLAEQEKNPSDAHIVAINSKMDTFLEQVTKRINQMELKLEANAINNNRLNYQNASFSPMMIQQTPQLQSMPRMV